MPSQPVPLQSPALNIGDIYYVLFRHKWAILVCTILGLGAAATLYKLDPPPYQSDAKLFIKYVLSEGRNLAPVGIEGKEKSPDQRGETILNSEIEILKSLDLAKQVATAVGPDKILQRLGGGSDPDQAAAVVNSGLYVANPWRSSIIYLSFMHKDPAVVQPVLQEAVTRYLKMHGEIHRSKGMVGDFLIQETDQLRARLQQTDEDLRKARSRAGVNTSIEEAKHSINSQLTSLRQQIFAAQADLAERISVQQTLSKLTPAETQTEEQPRPEAPAAVPQAKLEEYATAVLRWDNLRKREQDLLTQFTAESPRVQEVRNSLAEAEAAKRKLEAEYPRLLSATTASSSSSSARPTLRPERNGTSFDAATAAAEITALQAKIKQLNAQVDLLREEAAKIDAVEAEISQLNRKKELDETNYKLFAASAEQTRIADAMGGTSRVSNINVIQQASPPVADWSKKRKRALAVAVGGLVLGLAWAFAFELYLDRSVRRPIDVERQLRLPLFISIPDQKAKGRLTAAAADAPASTSSALVTLNGGGPLQVFHETLRDRLVTYFESQGLTHKPKLIAVAGLEKGAGVTTTAAGLAQSLSETGDGNVLLVDMTAGQGSAQQYVKGKAICGLDELLDSRSNARVEENLYIVAGNHSESLSRNLPQRFSKLIPKLKASDFDYIIFDMPTISQISITPRLAGLMDIVLLVVESEKTNRDLVNRATDLLAQSKAQVGVVLNKTRNYVPAKLNPEFLNSAAAL